MIVTGLIKIGVELVQEGQDVLERPVTLLKRHAGHLLWIGVTLGEYEHIVLFMHVVIKGGGDLCDSQ